MEALHHPQASLDNHIRELHKTEVTHLAAKHAPPPATVFRMVHEYMLFLKFTWGNVLRSMMFLSLNPIDFVTVLTFAVGCTIILGIMLLVCVAFKILPMSAILATFICAANRIGLNVTNRPRNIFRSITQPQVDAARAALARSPASPTRKGERTFDIDIAKLLLQLSALMYERGTNPIVVALAAHNRSETGPGEAATEEQIECDHAKGDDIREFCRAFGLDYAPVSELNASDSAYSALFWDPDSSWIVVAFKGTSPTEYTEWVSDFNYDLVDAGDWLPGFSKVHGGFLQRIFPCDVTASGGIRPWDTITTGINLIAKSLRQKSQGSDTKINLFFTGHSLGCAIASLAYARAVLVGTDFGENIVVRDGYLFAAPIVCDVASVKAFDGAINKDYDMPRTLWRVTNMKDIVATGLPAYGDRMDSRFLNNSLLNFAHLGAEIRMRSKPVPSQVAGWPHITRGLPVVVSSCFPIDTIGMITSDEGMSAFALQLEKLPLVGRFFQHATNFYWDQLQRVGLGLCQWVKDD